MKKTFGLLLTLSFGMSLYAGTLPAKPSSKAIVTQEKTTAGIAFFHGTWAEALAKSKTEKKLIFLDAYAAWCGPCKTMAKYTFTEKEVGDFFNANFINVKMDMEKDPEGRRLSTKYGLRAYPTLYFINGDEDVVHQALGMQKPAQLIEIGKNALAVQN